MNAKHFFRALLLLSLALLCLALAWDGVAMLRHFEEAAVLRDAGLTAADYDALLLREPEASQTRFALFAQRSDVAVEAPEHLRRQTVELVTIRGDSRLVLPVFAALADGDTNGCLLDRGTARHLFGEAAAVGAVVQADGQRYTVRGVFDSPVPMMAIQATARDTSLPHIALAGDAEAFRLRHSLAGSVTQQRYLLHAAVLLAGLPLLAAAFLLLRMFLRLRKKWRAYPARAMLLSAASITLLTMSILLLLRYLPGEYVPSRWSDFAFWGELLPQLHEGLRRWLFSAKYAPDMLAIGWLGKSLWGIPAAWLLMRLRR